MKNWLEKKMYMLSEICTSVLYPGEQMTPPPFSVAASVK